MNSRVCPSGPTCSLLRPRLIVKTLVKKLLLGEGRKGRRIPLGLFRGLTLSIDPAVETNIYLGLYERETYSWLREAGKQARSLVDVGAGVGELTLWGLAHDDIRRVLAYDPAPHRWEWLRENLRLNGRLADPRLSLIEDYFLGSSRTEEDQRILQDIPEPVLFKIDVDGGEEAILRELMPMLRGKQCLFLIETHSRALDAACGSMLAENGYRVSSIRPAWWRRFLPENRSLEFNQWLVARKPAR